MNDYKVPGIWKWSVVLLVLCNMGLMLTIWLKPHHGPDNGHGPRDYVIRSLKLSDEQVKKYDELIKVHHQAMEQLGKEGSEYRRQLFENLGNEHQVGAYTDSLAQLIANNQKQVELVTYNHFAQVRAICNDTQKVEFDKIINDVMKKMHGGMHDGPHGDGQGPPPDRDGPDHPHDGQGPPPQQNP